MSFNYHISLIFTQSFLLNMSDMMNTLHAIHLTVCTVVCNIKNVFFMCQNIYMYIETQFYTNFKYLNMSYYLTALLLVYATYIEM